MLTREQLLELVAIQAAENQAARTELVRLKAIEAEHAKLASMVPDMQKHIEQLTKQLMG